MAGVYRLLGMVLAAVHVVGVVVALDGLAPVAREVLVIGRFSRLPRGHGLDDHGTAWQERGLKHRAAHETRTIPIAPELVKLLRAHIKWYGTTLDGRIVQTARAGILQGSAYGFERCIGLAMSDGTIKLSEADAGTLRAIDAMRDDEQHWFNEVSEQILYLHVRAAVTLFDDVLQRVFGERLSTVLPERVLPVSAGPPKDLALLLDDEYTQIRQLLRPGRRAGHEARARIRTLLAMEAHVEPGTRVSEKDVDRVEKGIRNGDPRDKVFPRLSDVATTVDGEGLTITVHFTKKDGAPVRYAADDSTPAAAIRQIDLQNKYRRPRPGSPSTWDSRGLVRSRSAATSGSMTTTPAATTSSSARSGILATPTTPSPRCATRYASWTWTPYGRRTTLRARRARHAPFRDARQSDRSPVGRCSGSSLVRPAQPGLSPGTCWKMRGIIRNT